MLFITIVFASPALVANLLFIPFCKILKTPITPDKINTHIKPLKNLVPSMQTNLSIF